MFKMLQPFGIVLVFLFLSGVHLKSVDFIEKTEVKLPKNQATTGECHYKIVGTQGSIYSPQISESNVTCEWDIDVTKGFVVILEFENLKLPVNQEQACESYVEVSYGTQNDPIKRTLCPNTKMDTLHTNSQIALIKYHSGTYSKEYEGNRFGFKINYSAIALSKPATGNFALIILLISFAALSSIALCIFFFRCRHGHNNMGVPSQMGVTEPNVPTQQQLQEAFEFQRRSIQGPLYEPRKMSFSIFQSQASSGNSSLNRWASNPHLPDNRTYVISKEDKNNLSIETTPRSVFPKIRRKWSEGSVNRMAHLRTKLVARFSSASSHNSSDISVFFPASDRSAYSQLSCDDVKEFVDRIEDGKSESKPPAASSPRPIPSIVIEFVE
jgi:hypothetical protein